MKVLFDIVHPQHVLFFKNSIKIFSNKKADISVVSRNKDITLDLLDSLNIKHTVLSSAKDGLTGLVGELIMRDYRLLKHAKTFQPDVMVGFGGVAISHVGKILGIPSISFYDSENAKLQNVITWPFISRLFVPESYTGPTPQARTKRLKGIKSSAFLSPKYFKPSFSLAKDNGFETGVPNFFIRLVKWSANHDVGKKGIDIDFILKLVEILEAKGKVHISSERPLPKCLAGNLYRGNPAEVHHLIAFCKFLIGESATMACEASILGVPSCYVGHDFPGYTKQFENLGLIRTIKLPVPNFKVICGLVDELISVDKNLYERMRDNYINSSDDWTQVVVQSIEELVQHKIKQG